MGPLVSGLALVLTNSMVVSYSPFAQCLPVLSEVLVVPAGPRVGEAVDIVVELQGLLSLPIDTL